MINLLVRVGLLITLAGLLSASRSAHDFHASVTQMQYDPKERTFEISIRIFTDDFEKALAEASKSKVNLNATGKNDPLIEKYIQSHFGYVNAQKQAKPIKYVGYEVETDAHWIYLEMPYIEPFRGGSLKQNVLMELFDDQVNMVNVQYQGQKKTFVFRKNQSIQDISVN
ncbi:DUF6702 family protein [Spirosoma flavum]|uniref:DUF6702 family protein n=1 Tax=Spirosoma flavum TaxID=2048557 RepID=A0ABW6AKS2_9BACT